MTVPTDVLDRAVVGAFQAGEYAIAVELSHYASDQTRPLSPAAWCVLFQPVQIWALPHDELVRHYKAAVTRVRDCYAAPGGE